MMDFQSIKRFTWFSRPKNPERDRAAKRYLRIGGIVVAVLVLILIVLPLFINVNSFKPKVEAQASAALGRRVTIGKLALSLFSGNVGADNITIADDPAFGSSPFLTAKSLKIGVELIPLIFSKQLKVTDITLERPQVTLLKAANGKWNFSSLGNPSAGKESSSGGARPANFSIDGLNVNQGKVFVGKPSSVAKPAVYDNVNINVKNFSVTAPFPFRLEAQLPGSGNVNISGKAGPIDAEDSSKTPLAAAVKVNNMNLAGSGFVNPASGIAGVVSFVGTVASNGRQATAIGRMTGRQMKFSPRGTPAPMTITVKHIVDLDLDKQMATIKQGDVAIGNAQMHLTGSVQTQGEEQVVNLRLDAPNLPVDEIEAALPAAGVVLPSGSKLKGGTLSAELAIAGPLDKLVITGPVRISNSQLANFDLGSKLGALQAFTGKATSSPNTSIQNVSLNARVAPEGTQANDINLTVPAIGVITGSGTITPAGALAFKMLANLRGGIAEGLTKIAGASAGRGGIPFAIEGTTSNPKFVPDIGGVAAGLAKGEIGNIAKGQISGQGAVTKGIGGILGHKIP